MRKVFIIILALCFDSLYSGILAQTTFDEQEGKISRWLSDIHQPSEICSKVKTKHIKYKSWGYSIEVDLSKKEIFPGSNIKIFDADNKLILDGTVTSTESPIAVKGRRSGADNEIELLGSFAISNTPEGGLELKPNKAADIAISTSTVDYILASDFGNPVIINTAEKIITLKEKSMGRGFSCIVAQAPEIQPQTAMDIDIRAMLGSMSNNITVFYEGRTFNGKVKAEVIDLNPVTYLMETGTLSYDDGKIVSITKSSGNYVMTISGDPQINSGEETCYTVPISSIPENDLWSEEEFIRRAAAYQEQLEETHSVSESVSSALTKASEDSDPGASSGGSTLDGIMFLLLIFIGVASYVHHLIHARDCPHCGKTHAMIDVNKINIGKAYVKKERQPDGTYAEVHCNRYKTIRRCRYCGYEDCKLTNEKGRPF